jgi:hypothetical protein
VVPAGLHAHPKGVRLCRIPEGAWRFR